MEADSGTKIKELRVDGGASENKLLMQIQSNVLNTQIAKPGTSETTALGAAYLAGLGIGFWKDIPELETLWQKETEFTPKADFDRESLIRDWSRAVKAARAWAKDGENQ